MKTFEQKIYCGIVQNEIQRLTGVFGSATSTGQSLTFKEKDLTALKELNLPLTNVGRGFYMLMVGKKVCKQLGVMAEK